MMTSWWSTTREYIPSDFEQGLFSLPKRSKIEEKPVFPEIVPPYSTNKEEEPPKVVDKFVQKVLDTFIYPLGSPNLFASYFASSTKVVDPTAHYNYQQLLKHTPEQPLFKEKEQQQQQTSSLEERDIFQRSLTGTPKFISKKRTSLREASISSLKPQSPFNLPARDQYQQFLNNKSTYSDTFKDQKEDSLNESGFSKLFDPSILSTQKGQKRKMGNKISSILERFNLNSSSSLSKDLEILDQYRESVRLPASRKLVPYDDSIIQIDDDDDTIDLSFIDERPFPNRSSDIERSIEVQPYPIDNEIVQKGLNNSKIYDLDARRAEREYKFVRNDIIRKSERDEFEKHSLLYEEKRIKEEIEREKRFRNNIGTENIVVDFPKGSESFPELPSEAVQLIARAWQRHANEDEIFVDASSVKITRKDLKTLSGLDWLNDEVINFYLDLVVKRSKEDTSLPKVYAFQTFFYSTLCQKGYAGVKRWTKKVDVFAYDLWIVPVHLTHHWCMAIVDIQNQRIEYYDSMLGNNKQVFEVLSSYITAEMKDKKKQDLQTTHWERSCRKDIPTQQNGSDCGMFACKFAEYASRRAPIDFNQEHMPYFRKRIVWEICQQKLM